MKVYTNGRLCSVCGHYLVSTLPSKMIADSDEDHFNPSVRVVEFEKSGSANCGFYLTRGKWDPYPWVSRVDQGSLANLAGLKTGDCLLEVCGEDVVGRRISEIAEIVKSKPGHVSLLVWNAGVDAQCTPEALCCGPIPSNLQRLSACMSTILAFLECPVCLETIPPPTYQCDNGHLICVRCRMKSERCPVCRYRLSRGRSLLSDQVYHAIIDSFNLRDETVETRAAKIQQIFKQKSKSKNVVPNIKVTQCHTTKFLAKLVGKASSVENLSSNSKFLSPNGEDNTLKVKSLSSNEIFNAESPTVSRIGSISKLNRLKLINGATTMDDSLTNISDFDNRANSYNGSLDFSEVNAVENESINDVEDEKDVDMTFNCPFDRKCAILLKGSNVTEHFRFNHSGPLVQYFGSHIDFPVKKLENETCFIINFEGKTFFIKSVSKFGYQSNNTENNSEDLIIWAWYLGSSEKSKMFDIEVELKNSIADHSLLRVKNSVFSLNAVSFQDIMDLRKGIFFSSNILKTVGSIDDTVLSVAIIPN